MKNRKWTPEEDEYLVTMYGTGLIDVMVERLERTKKSIQLRAHRLRIPSGRRRGCRLEPDRVALATLDGAVVADADVLNRVRIATGVAMATLEKRSGYKLNDKRLLNNPTLRKAIDVAGALGFELVLRRRA